MSQPLHIHEMGVSQLFITGNYKSTATNVFCFSNNLKVI